MKYETIGLITYNYSHLKTEQVFENLLRKRLCYKFKFYALPFKNRSVRNVTFLHRPDQFSSVSIESIANYHNIEYKICSTDNDIDNSCDIYILLGGGILSEECVRDKKILNCHPGIIPLVRGLDAFKWSIYDMKPLGVTLHYINENIDDGEVISVERTNVYKSDNITSLARRHYETEIDMISNFDYYLSNPKNEFENCDKNEAKRRMNVEIEQKMLKSFNLYLEKFYKD